MLFISKVIVVSLLIISLGHTQDTGHNYCQQTSNYVEEYSRAYDAMNYLPQLQISSKEQAYLIQACVVISKAQKIIGFKAGLVSESSQAKFLTDEPVLGVLTLENLKDLGIGVNESDKISLIEVELAFRLKQKIDSLSMLDNEVNQLVGAVAPALEIPLFHFKDKNSLISNDIIAANVGANIFMLGDFVPIEGIDIDSIMVSLSKDGEVIGSSVESNAANRGKLLRWLIKKSYLEGYDLKQGTIYLTGALINPVIVRKAMYQVNYSQMEEISLVVK